MKFIDKVEEKVLYIKKKREGKRADIIRREITLDKEQIKVTEIKKLVREARIKKDPKEVNKRFKESFGNLR